MPLNIIIAGGGIGGLAAAGYLRAEHNVTVLERSPVGLEPDDYGLSVVTYAFDLLQKAGIKLANLDTVVMTHVWVRNHRNEEVKTVEFDTRSRFGGAPSILAKRSDIQRELERFATSMDFPGQPAKLIRGARAVNVDTDAGTITVEDGRMFNGDLIIGADGINSLVRSAIPQKLALPRAPRTHNLLLFMTRVRVEAIQAVPDLGYLAKPAEQAGLVSCYGPEGPQSKRRILVYNISPLELQVLGYTTEKELAEAFERDKTSIIRGIPTSRVVDEFSGEFSDSLVDLFRHGRIDAWRIRDIPPLGQWYHERVVLLGDAAHAVTPHAGQGCNITIKDAEALGYLLRSVRSSSELQDALEIFVKMRKNRADYVARRSRELGNIQSPDDVAKGRIGPEAFARTIYAYQGAEQALMTSA